MLPSYGENIFKITNFFPEYLIFNGSFPITIHIGGGAVTKWNYKYLELA
jgi:hypothetical protein